MYMTVFMQEVFSLHKLIILNGLRTLVLPAGLPVIVYIWARVW